MDEQNPMSAWDDPLADIYPVPGNAPATAFSWLAGVFVALIIGSAAFAGWRVIDSEDEGFRALFFSVPPILCAIPALIACLILTRRNASPAVQVIPIGLSIALAVAGCLWLRQQL